MKSKYESMVSNHRVYSFNPYRESSFYQQWPSTSRSPLPRHAPFRPHRSCQKVYSASPRQDHASTTNNTVLPRRRLDPSSYDDGPNQKRQPAKQQHQRNYKPRSPNRDICLSSISSTICRDVADGASRDVLHMSYWIRYIAYTCSKLVRHHSSNIIDNSCDICCLEEGLYGRLREFGTVVPVTNRVVWHGSNTIGKVLKEHWNQNKIYHRNIIRLGLALAWWCRANDVGIVSNRIGDG